MGSSPVRIGLSLFPGQKSEKVYQQWRRHSSGMGHLGSCPPWSLRMHANFADLTPDGFHFWMTLSPRTSELVRHTPVPSPWSKFLTTPLFTKSGICEREGLLWLTAQCAACETWNAHPSCCGRCLKVQILRERGHPLPKCWYRFKVVDNFALGVMKLYNRL